LRTLKETELAWVPLWARRYTHHTMGLYSKLCKCSVCIVLFAILVQWVIQHYLWHILFFVISKYKAYEMAREIVCVGEQMVTTSTVQDFQPLSWDESYKRAGSLLAQLTAEEKYGLMQGRGWVINDPKKWYYTGNTVPVPRLRIPSFNMQDAAGGVRTMWSELVGTVTCWPSALALAATWDPDMVREFAAAMADEFAMKGVNMVLGPSVQVHRVARNGRNFEYLSGEDPYLGARLAEAYVEGVNSRGLMTSVKHWGFNEQETHRNTESSVVDEKTAFELYYPPFQAAIDAGVTTVMCGYNKVDGEHACSSRKMLTEVLRQRMGFRGFVHSDWWATHGTALHAGLDQEMPGNNMDPFRFRPDSVHFAAETLKAIPDQLIDTAVTRILAAMYRMGHIGKEACVPPCCETLFRRNATSEEHAKLAREAAIASVVLLKNQAAVLPISSVRVKTLAVVGSAAVGKPYDPAGSSQEFGGALTSWNTGDYYAGGGSGHVTAGYVVTPLEGIRTRAAAAGIRVISSVSNDVGAALGAAAEADVTIIVGATTSGEDKDRQDLNLDGKADQLIETVSKKARSTIVVAQVPGAVVMPWRDSVAAIALMFLGGQETGSAWASILFGDDPPIGRLPLMIPATERDTIQPGAEPEVVYSEGMRTSYRNPGFKAAYPFGHGLTYTTFEYGELAVCEARAEGGLCLSLDVLNAGRTSAGTVAQLYAEFPAEAGHPAPLLRGFRRTGRLAPAASAGVEFHLSVRDLSFYDAKAHAWEKTASITAHVGESSADIRRTISLREDKELRSWVASR